MIKINIICNSNIWFKYIRNPNNFLQNKINNLNKNYKKYKDKNIYCTLLLSESKEIKRLNKKFRKKNKTTDVLSFPFHEKKELKKVMKKDREIYLGDILINVNKIKKKIIKKISIYLSTNFGFMV